MLNVAITADDLISALLRLASSEIVCILDSCGVRHLGSHLLIAGIDPVETIEISNENADETLRILNEKLSGELACVFTLSYDFGLKLLGLDSQNKASGISLEPDVFIARFDVIIVHDYDSGRTILTGNVSKFETLRCKLDENISNFRFEISNKPPSVTSNFSKSQYLAAIETVKERIRCGDTYQTNLTQQITANLPENLTPAVIFHRLRRDHPTPFSAFIKRVDSTVVSASPERFIKIGGNQTGREGARTRTITTSPIKGTRPRGTDPTQDNDFRNDLITSTKDRSENTMIVDLLRNDLGRICEYGSVRVEKLCDLEEHPTLFHLVSTISGDLRPDTTIPDILKAVFPCGSITGAPKISTMGIIDEIEAVNRGLSMGAIGYYIPGDESKVQGPRPKDGKSSSWTLDPGHWTSVPILDLSVAIRTMVIRDNTATFNVGGGIVIDSNPESEYEETLTKAKALLGAMGLSSEFPKFGVPTLVGKT